MILIIKHIGIEGPGSIGDFFRASAWRLVTVELGEGQRLPSGLQGVEAVVSLGGPMSVYEEEKFPFLKEEDAFLKKALQEQVPVLGICLGAQLLAKACGAAIKKHEVREAGWQRIRLTEEGTADPLFEGLPPKLLVFQWHQDTFELPTHGMLLAEGSACRNQAFRIGRNAYGLQFHIEVSPLVLASWAEAYKEEAQGLDIKGMLIESYRVQEEFERQAQALCLNFARIIERARKAPVV